MKQLLLFITMVFMTITTDAVEIADIDYSKLDYKKVKIGGSNSQLKRVFKVNFNFIHKERGVDEHEFNKKLLVWSYQRRIVQYRILLDFEGNVPFWTWAERLTKFKKADFVIVKKGEESTYISKDGKVKLIANPAVLDILYKPSIDKVGEQD